LFGDFKPLQNQSVDGTAGKFIGEAASYRAVHHLLR
jgi:hypothetical protein